MDAMTTLKQIRRELGLGQQEMASLLGVSQAYIGMVERGYRSLSAELFQKLCEIKEAHVKLSIGMAPINHESIAAMKDSVINTLNKKIINQQHELDGILYKVQKMEEEFVKSGKLLLFLKDKLESNTLSMLEREEYNGLYLRTEQCWLENAPERRLLMRWKIESLQFSIDKAKVMLARYR